MVPESHGLVDMPVTIDIKDHVPTYPYLIVRGDGIVRPCDRHSNETITLRNMLPNIKTCKIGRSNFSENLRIVAL